MTRRDALLIFGYAILATPSAWGFPWNLPAVLLGGFAVGLVTVRGVSR